MLIPFKCLTIGGCQGTDCLELQLNVSLEFSFVLFVKRPFSDVPLGTNVINFYLEISLPNDERFTTRLRRWEMANMHHATYLLVANLYNVKYWLLANCAKVNWHHVTSK